MAVEEKVGRPDDPLIGTRKRADYTPAERQFSVLLHRRLQELLRGESNSLDLLRRYPNQPNRLGIIPTPPGIAKDQLRLDVVEKLTWEAVSLVRSTEDGGPVAQAPTRDGGVVETQIFPTKYPHVVIERTDRFDGDGQEPVETTWCLRRVQNQRAQTQINRLLDAINLGLELVRFIR